MPKRSEDLAGLSEEELLNTRIRNLGLSLENTWLAECIQELYSELDSRGIKLKPPCYLADEWLIPDGEPVVGIPFFLAHPALMKLEKKMMLDVEGGSKDSCLKLLRHEAGHAINYAYKLYKSKKWHKIFGPFYKEYSDTYRFRPYSRSFVRHLEDYYAQYHPDEDFAETFAVWLTPGLDWRMQYKGWKAMEKLNYVDELMQKIKDKEPLVKQGKKYWEARRMSITLKNFYKKKKHFYAEDFPDFHDSNLRKIFPQTPEGEKKLLPAAEVIKRYRKDILNNVSELTGEKKYIIDGLLANIAGRLSQLKLVISDSEEAALIKVCVYVTSLIMNYFYTGKFRKKK